jgi:DNA-binding protein YbaB
MFEDVSGIMHKLKEAQQEVKKTKTRLSAVFISKISANNKIKRTLTPKSVIKNISIKSALLSDAKNSKFIKFSLSTIHL